MILYNTLARQEQEFKPLSDDEVKIYTCGPTVYDYQHIGNYSGYIYWDILVRTLRLLDCKVNRVMNITDVGHLVSDGDEGEDKLEKGAAREGKSPREVADFYTNDFLVNFKNLGLVEPAKIANATDFIDQQLGIIRQLVDKGFAYKTEAAIYFETSKLEDYGKLTGQKLSDKEVGARNEVVTDAAKHHPQDFALWFFTVGRFANHEMHWPSPWGEGFPGWHIECSAIIHALLGDPIDIHTGGIDHIGTHHTNEIAQTEAAFGHELSKYWLHNNHMMVDGTKISKSLGNGLRLQDLQQKGYSPMDFKLLVLQSHYRNQTNFTWEALDAAKNRLRRFKNVAELRFQPTASTEAAQAISFDKSKADILEQAQQDINTPQILTAIDSTLEQVENFGVQKHSLDNYTNWLSFIDDLLGLDLMNSTKDITSEQKQVIARREAARTQKDWATSDKLRDELIGQRIGLRDTPAGVVWFSL